MSNNYSLYAITEVYLIVYTAIMLFRLNENLGTEYEVRELKNIIYSYFAVLVTDIFWVLVEGGLIHPGGTLNAAINGIWLSAVCAGCYFWYNFVEYRLNSKSIYKKTVRTFMKVPIGIAVALNLLSVATGWVFYIDTQSHYTPGKLFALQAMICYLYLLIPTAKSLRRAVKTHSRLQRREYLLYAAYVAAPSLAGLFEMAVPWAPVLCLNMFTVIYILFLTIQDMHIYNDALTGLYNRRRLSQFLEERLTAASPEHPVSIFMIDVNQFKAINDTFGHVEGDGALKLVAEALKMTAVTFSAFAARYGGDELCLVVEGNSCHPQQVMDHIRQSLDTAQQDDQIAKNYTISISIGHAVCHTPEYDINRLLNEADQRLYEDKKQWHRDQTK